MGKYFAVIDPGSKSITAVAAKWNKTSDYILEGFCRVGSRGFHKGLVTDSAMAADSVSAVLKKLREKTGRRIHDVYAGISSTSVKVIRSSGVLLLSKYGREIHCGDIERCVHIGSTIKLPLDKEPLHRSVEGFSIDGEREIKNPLNLEGVKLGVRVNILTINSTVLRNMSRCISQAGFIPSGFVFSGLASAQRVLTGEKKDEGVILLDISEDITEVMVFYRGVLNSCMVLPLGAVDISQERRNIETAVLDKLVSQLDSLPGKERIRKAVVIGEGLLVDNLIDSLERIFSVPVSAGTCIVRPFEELPPERAGYICSLGILDHLQHERQKQRRNGNVLKRVFDRGREFIDRYF
ncbi:MAG: hypothetical protein U9R44_02140 [Candidatus Omnitrophota bacterium]|nr:hypothetical protein [Candidatus Omnitrophota bacterium]